MALSCRALTTLCILMCVVALFVFYVEEVGSHKKLPNSFATTLHGHGAPFSSSKNAYCTFLAEPNDMIKSGEDDVYFVGIRMLAYQLLHDPDTRTNNSVPFVVLVQQEVPEWKRGQLRRAGASVVEVERIKIPWIKPGRIRWTHVMDKLHVFELTQYDKILLFDSDIVVTKRMDSIFDEVDVMPNRGDASHVKYDEAPQPSEYLIAGNCGPIQENHGYPAPRCNRLNAGFVLLKPSTEMFNFYMSLANIEGRFPEGSPEQDLWNYAHRLDGNMPWKQINPDWNANSPNYGDYENGIASFHEKYWKCERDRKLRDVLLRSRWKMEGFFNSLDPDLA